MSCLIVSVPLGLLEALQVSYRLNEMLKQHNILRMPCVAAGSASSWDSKFRLM